MPFDAAGVYTLPQAAFTTLTVMSSSAVNSDFSDIGSALGTLYATAALSAKGRASNSSGPMADITATAASAAVLRESGSALSFGTIATAGIADAAITLAKLESRGQTTLLGRQDGAGTGAPQELSATNAMTILRTLTRFYAGSFTRDLSLSTSVVTITGVGFQPKALVLLSSGDTAMKLSSVGFADEGIGTSGMYWDLTNARSTFISTPVVIAPVSITSGNYVLGTPSAYTSDGFTFTWVKVGSPTGTGRVTFLAFR